MNSTCLYGIICTISAGNYTKIGEYHFGDQKLNWFGKERWFGKFILQTKHFADLKPMLGA